ncbi:MAG: hypothetical protein QF903_06230 [Planctomycetota bacterium]|jgi:hypothetical protein|nr:hypothetical protein [Planctomycetota bacterium]
MPPLSLLLALPIAGSWPASVQDVAPAPQGEALKLRVNAAIDLGVDYLLRAQNRDGSWGPAGGRLQEGHFDRRYGHTALAVYTLVKSGLAPTHPSVRRGTAYMLGGFPTKVYSAACETMALAALGDAAHRPRIEELLEFIESLRKRGVGNAWGYPGLGAGHVDLSNTQYAALALRSADTAGVEVSQRTWRSVIETVLEFQRPVEVAESRRARGAGANDVEVAPFSYDRARSGGGHAPSASMTAAGVSILGICAEGLGDKLVGAPARRVSRACERGLAWLARPFSVTENRGGSSSWLYYYLYGLERVGALFELDRIGEHDWYWEGARFLVDDQAHDGRWETDGDANWPPAPMTNANTCFALLFLTRATKPRPSTGADQAVAEGVYRAEDPASQVWIRASGSAVLTAWVSGFGAGVQELLAEPEGPGIEAVEWFVDGDRVARLEGDPARAWDRGAKYALRHAFARAGAHEVRVEVHLTPSRASADGQASGTIVSSAVLSVEADDVLEEWMLDYAGRGGINPLSSRGATASASSQLDGRWSAGRAIDGMEFSPWLCSVEDEHPTLVIELRRNFKADRVLLSQVNANPVERGRRARVDRVGILINRSSEMLEFTLEPDERLVTVCPLPKAIGVRRVEIRILERTDGRESSAAGFAEVSLAAP